MTTPASPPNLPRSESLPVALRIVQALSAVAFCLSLYLLFASTRQSRPLGCGSESGCGRVLGSPWSRWLGFPVAAPAAILYLTILAAAVRAGRRSSDPGRRAATVLAAGSMLAGGAGIWFIALQAFATGICPYCLAVHLCGLLLCALAPFTSARLPSVRPAASPAPLLLSLGGLAALIVGQALFRPPTYRIDVAGSHPPEPDDGARAGVMPHPWFQVPGGRFDLDASRVPVVGSPAARHFIVVLNDYACPHCRSTRHVLDQVLRAYGDDVALVVLPTPLDRACNPLLLESHPPEPQDCALNRLALAVWCADPKSFAPMDRWLFAADRARREDEAREYAARLVGAARLGRAEGDFRIAPILRQDAEIYARCNGGPLPRLMFGATAVSGAVDDYRALFPAIEKEWHIRPARDAP